MKKRNHIKKISNYAMVGGLGAILVTSIVACNDRSNGQQSQSNAFTNASEKQNAFVVIEQRPDGSYTIADEYPASKTTIILRKPDGNERILSKEEIDRLIKEEAVKIDNGTSSLTNSQMSNGSMGLGGILLSSIAGGLLGSWIGSKLFNNANYQNQRRAQYKSPQTYSRSKSSFTKAKSSARKSSSTKRSGFFGSKSGSSRSGSFFGG